MRTVRSVTANFLGSYASVHTRKRYKKDIVTWQRWCAEQGVHPLDCSTANAQQFVAWMSERYTSTSVASRVCGVAKWFDALVDGGVLRSHGLHSVRLPKREIVLNLESIPTDAEMMLVMDEARKLGPRWEWLAGMVAWAGCDCQEALRVRGMDVRTWEGKTLVTVRSRKQNRREIPVDGRLEVLTVGLQAVYAPTTPLAGTVTSEWATIRLGKVASEATGRRLNVQDMRRWAVRRQFERGVPIPVIARWLGHTTDRWVRQTLRLTDEVALVTANEMIASILVEPDGDRYGSGQAPDSII